MTRLFDMGIQTKPNVVEIVNRYTEGKDNANEEEVLVRVINALNIRSTPSPRPRESGRRR
jgi:hypothetical protein